MLFLGLSCLVDKERPEVQITYPPNGTTVGSEVSVSADATDNRSVTKVEFFIDGTFLDSSKTRPYSCQWIAARLPDSTTHTIYARAYDAAHNEGMSQVVAVTIQHGNSPPGQPSAPAGPTSTWTLDSCLFSARATDPDQDSVGIRFDWGDGVVSNWSPSVLSGQTVQMAHTFSLADTFLVRAQAEDKWGSVSRLSDPCTVTVFERHPGTPPTTPDKPTGTRETQPGIVEAFSARTTDPGGNHVRYEFDWGDGTYSLWSRFVPQGSTYSDTHSFANTGSFGVRARAQNTKGDSSSWSDTLIVSVLPRDTALKWIYAYLDESFDSVPFMGTVAASPAGYLHAVSVRGLLHTITQEGQRRSAYQTLENAEFVCPPMIWNDLAWVAAHDTTLRAIRVNGTRAFALPIRGDILGSLACDGNGRIFFNCDNDSLYCYDTLGWRWAAYTGGGASSPVITADDALVIVGGDDGRIHAFNADNGSTAWTWVCGGPVRSSAAIGSDGTIYIGSDDGSLYAMRPDGGAPLWQYPANSPVATSPVIDAAGIIYFTSDNGVVHAVNPTTHLSVWTHPLNSDGSSSGALTQNGVLFVKALYGAADSLIALNTLDGTGRWSAGLPGGTEMELVCSPLIDQYGTIYITTGTGVYAFWGQGLPAASAWPMFQHDPQRTGNASAKQGGM